MILTLLDTYYASPDTIGSYAEARAPYRPLPGAVGRQSQGPKAAQLGRHEGVENGCASSRPAPTIISAASHLVCRLLA
eukprot:2572799-Pleurochrysis_carterae.AAC.1